MYSQSGSQNFTQALKSSMERRSSLTEQPVNPIFRKPGVKPSNCTKTGSLQSMDDPYLKARYYIKQKPERICCTIDGGGWVTKWKVRDRAKVKLSSTDSRTTFYYHYKLSVE